MRTLIQCAPGFQAEIQALAAVAKMDPEQVYALWRKYDTRCTNYDQSPVISEFVSWYAVELGGDQLALVQALQKARNEALTADLLQVMGATA